MQVSFTDVHCHILHGIDDGPIKIEESVQMVRQAVSQGVTNIIATPHFIPEEIEYEVNLVLERVEELQWVIGKEGLQCTIHPGMELYLSKKLISFIDKGKTLSLGKDSKYLLVEFPGTQISPDLINLLHEINVRGFIPIIAHPERNLKILEEPTLINDLLQYNVLFQVNADSIIGKNGRTVQRLVQDFLTQGLISFVASDGHSIGRRDIHLKEAYSQSLSLIGDKARDLYWINGQKVLKSEKIMRENNFYQFKKVGLDKFLRIFGVK